LTVTYPFLNNGGRFRPFIPVEVHNPFNGKVLKMFALLDTGADTTTIPRPVVIGLGFDFKAGPNSTTKGVGGVDIATWKKRIGISLLDPSQTKVIKKYVAAQINCVNTDIPILLGTDNFLKDFKITFDYDNATVTLEFDETK
jgi:hypothetical protein